MLVENSLSCNFPAGIVVLSNNSCCVVEVSALKSSVDRTVVFGPGEDVMCDAAGRAVKAWLYNFSKKEKMVSAKNINYNMYGFFLKQFYNIKTAELYCSNSTNTPYSTSLKNDYCYY